MTETLDQTQHVDQIAAELSLAARQVQAVAGLLADGATIPFIARYRKEMTGSLDEVAISAVRDRLKQLAELAARREAILKSLTERNLLTPELSAKLAAAESMTALEDLYLPFRPKRQTRASVAKEKELEPLAERLLLQEEGDPVLWAAAFLDPEKKVETVEEALAGARDILAERISEDGPTREGLRTLYREAGTFVAKVIPGQEEAGAKFRDYFDLTEPLAQAPSHRVLALRRGAAEGHLSLHIKVPEERASAILEGLWLKRANPAGEQVRLALADGFKRLLAPSLEVEFRLASKKAADAEAIRVFAANLRELLLASPLGQKRVLAVDPGLRTGSKLAVLDRQGHLLTHETIYLFASDEARAKAAERLKGLIAQHQIEAVAVGNGTGGRETERFIRSLELSPEIVVVQVNEAGASVYSASEAAREEFPSLDVSLRGAVSIGRRLADPLAELVKIEPKAIGVGQYQHDVDQKALQESLDEVVESCVNAVGVEVNTASPQLLAYVSGLNQGLARNIVGFRRDHGPFKSRQELLQVPRLGPKAFEQAAGFLRLREADNPLDGSAVHPESYPVVEAMARDLGCSIRELMTDPALRAKIDLTRYVTERVGLPTLTDILAELAKPGRDPRRSFEAVHFAEGIEGLADLKPGLVLQGVVTNVTNFGAFVDVGVHQDGLVHISQLADRFVKHPAEVVKVQQKVTVRVLEVDQARRRISLTMRTAPQASGNPPRSQKEEKKAAPPLQRPVKPEPKKPAPFNDALARALQGRTERSKP